MVKNHTMEGLFIRRILCSAVLLLLFCLAIVNACHGTILVSGITEEEKSIILQEHNRLRQLVANGRYPGQPGAENMREMVWDDELAAKAQQWADNCQFRHDPHRTINRFTMGQNLAIIWSTAPLDPDDGDFPSRIKNWFNEVQKYSFGDAWSPKTGHYSQLVWGETSLVGCGYAEYKDTSKYNKLYVCNYGPGGNVVGYNPYEAGKPACDSYGMRPSSRYQGLCSAPNSNGISRNTIQTYEYTHTNTYNTNTQQHTIDTKTKTYTPPATPSTYYQQQPQPQQQLQISTHPTSSSYSSKQATTYTHSLTKAFKNFGSDNQQSPNIRSYTTEASHFQQNNNKYETYKPGKTEFQTAVRKHTILRTYINTSSRSSSSSTSGTQFEPVKIFFDSANEAPIKKGWSLLTWRG